MSYAQDAANPAPAVAEAVNYLRDAVAVRLPEGEIVRRAKLVVDASFSSTPANPAQVTDAWLVRTLADVVATIEAGEFYQDYDQSVADLRILRAAIGMGGQMVDALRTLLDCPDIADNDHKDEETHAAERLARAALTAAIGAGGQAVAQFLPTEDGEFYGDEYEGELTSEDIARIDAAWETHKAALPVAVIVDDNQPGRRAIIEITVDPPTLGVGTKLYAEPKAVALAHPAHSGQAVPLLLGMRCKPVDGSTERTSAHIDGWNDALNEAVTRLSDIAHPVQPGWRDMESAPKDAGRIAALEAWKAEAMEVLRPLSERCTETVRPDDTDRDGVTVKTGILRAARRLVEKEDGR